MFTANILALVTVDARDVHKEGLVLGHLLDGRNDDIGVSIALGFVNNLLKNVVLRAWHNGPRHARRGSTHRMASKHFFSLGRLAHLQGCAGRQDESL